MENIVFEIQFRPVVDKKGEVRYRKLRVLKRKGDSVEELTKGRLLTFLDVQFPKIASHLGEGERLLVELPLDFLLSKTLIEPLELKRLNFLLGEPVARLSRKKVFHLKELVKRYFENGLEISIELPVWEKFEGFLSPLKFSFYCSEPDGAEVSPVCFKGVDEEETFKRLKEKGDLFLGKLFGDYETFEEISALSYLQATISKALSLLEEEEVNIDDLEKLIKTDPQLTLSVIKYANSPLIAPPSPIKELRHAIVYLGLNRLQQFLVTLMVNQMATVDPEFENLALRISALGILMEKKGVSIGKFSKCQLFLAGIVLEFHRLSGKPLSSILDMLSPPAHCRVPTDDAEIKKIYGEITEPEIEKTVLELKKLLIGNR